LLPNKLVLKFIEKSTNQPNQTGHAPCSNKQTNHLPFRSAP
jgi:hypothetical protein